MAEGLPLQFTYYIIAYIIDKLLSEVIPFLIESYRERREAEELKRRISNALSDAINKLNKDLEKLSKTLYDIDKRSARLGELTSASLYKPIFGIARDLFEALTQVLEDLYKCFEIFVDIAELPGLMERIKSNRKLVYMYDLLYIIHLSYNKEEGYFIFDSKLVNWTKIYKYEFKIETATDSDLNIDIYTKYSNLHILKEKINELTAHQRLLRRIRKDLKPQVDKFKVALGRIKFHTSFFERYGEERIKDFFNQLIELLELLIPRLLK